MVKNRHWTKKKNECLFAYFRALVLNCGSVLFVRLFVLHSYLNIGLYNDLGIHIYCYWKINKVTLKIQKKVHNAGFPFWFFAVSFLKPTLLLGPSLQFSVLLQPPYRRNVIKSMAAQELPPHKKQGIELSQLVPANNWEEPQLTTNKTLK